MLIPVIALAIAMQKDSDTWNLNTTVDPKVKLSWDVTVDAQTGGQDHHAAFKLSRQLKSGDSKKSIVTFSWDHLEVDGQEGQEVTPWDAVVGSKGEIQKMDGDLDDSYRRMLSPLIFVTPEKPVAIGDKWTYDVKPTGAGAKITYGYEVKKTELLDGAQTIVLSSKFTEEGTEASTGEGTWWLSRVGRVVKFEIKLKNWIVPMAGSTTFDATIKGSAQ